MSNQNFSVNQEVAEMKGPSVTIENLDTYKTVVTELRTELEELIEEGYMTQPVAERVINEFMYNAFTQLVKLNLNS
jgi:hypothetical protein